MRAWELYEQGKDDTGAAANRRRGHKTARKPFVSLRHINTAKRLKAVRQAEREQQQTLWCLMYAQDDAEQQRLDQREAGLQAREEELRLRELRADLDRAIAKAEVSTQHREQLHSLAMRELNRRKKNFSATSS